MNQYFTICDKCGKTILMSRTNDGKWIPCNPNLFRFLPAGGPDSYIDEDGKRWRGTHDRMHDPNGKYGYRLHRKDCKPNANHV